DLDLGVHLEGVRFIFELRSSRFTERVLATRGNRLALVRVRIEASEGGDTGPSEAEYLQVNDVDDHGDAVALVAFDPDDLDAAYPELDARYAAGEAAPYAAALEFGQRVQRANAARDLEALAALCAPDFVVQDHSPLGWGTLDRPTYLESLKVAFALTQGSRVRTDHLWLSDRGVLGVHLVHGTYEGGAFEQPRVTVSELDAQGRERRRDMYTPD